MEKKVLGIQANIAYALMYFLGFIGGIILLVADPDDRTSKFVAWQAIFISIGMMTCIGYIPFLIFGIIAIVKALQGNIAYKIWLIGDWAENLANK